MQNLKQKFLPASIEISTVSASRSNLDLGLFSLRDRNVLTKRAPGAIIQKKKQKTVRNAKNNTKFFAHPR